MPYRREVNRSPDRRTSKQVHPAKFPVFAEALESRTLMTVPAGFAESQVVTNLRNPTAMDIAPDGRIFVSEQPGDVKIVKDGKEIATPFFTVPTVVLGERGLSSVVLDPNFAQNGYVYMYWTVPEANGAEAFNRITRVTASGDVADPASAVTIFDGDGIGPRINHMSGAMHFGADGKLYVAMGESNKPDYAQSFDNVLGKLLRLNPDGSIPTDNPYYNEVTGKNRAIYLLGLRNTFTFAIQPGTGRIFGNDVGNASWEEINELLPHKNYGWPIIEGHITTQTPPTDYVDPLYAYPHTTGCAVTGCSFYNPTTPNFPAEYVGDYFFADLCKSFVKTYNPVTKEVKNFAFQIQRPVDIDIGSDGSMYILNNARDADPGGITRVTWTRSLAPSVGTQPKSQTISVGQPVTFTVAASGQNLSYQWQRDGKDIDGATSTSYTIDSVKASDDGAQFRVRVTNSSGSALSNVANLTVTTNQPPTPVITSPAAGTTYRAGDSFTFTGAGTDPEDGALPPTQLTWEVLFHHDEHTHPFLSLTSGSSISFTIPTSGEVSDNVWYRIHLTAQDSQGLTREVFQDLNPQKADFTVNTNIPGLTFTIDGQPQTQTFTDTGVIGVERQLGAAPVQTLNGQMYLFTGWSDGGAAEHVVSTPEVATTYTAVYRPRTVGEQLPGVDLSAALLTAPPAQITGGLKGKTAVKVLNDGDQISTGDVKVDLFLSTDSTLDDADPMVTTLTKRLSLKPGKSKALKLSYLFPSVADGSYYMLARAERTDSPTEIDATNNIAASATTVPNRMPVIDFSGTFLRQPATLAFGRRAAVSLNLYNIGNSIANGAMEITTYLTTDPTGQTGLTEIGDLSKKLKLRPGRPQKFDVKFILPAGLAAGTYYLATKIDAANAFAEVDETNNLFVSQAPITVS